MIYMTLDCITPTQFSVTTMLVWSVCFNFTKMFVWYYRYVCIFHLYFTR